MSRVVVTGANGFVGGAVVRFLSGDGYEVRGAVRRRPMTPVGSAVFAVGDIDGRTDWTAALQGCDAVVHTAARVHQMRDLSADPLTEFRRVNTEGTLRLAHDAVKAGVRRFVFLSSIKVNGEATVSGHPFRADGPTAPGDPYAVSKWEAESGLQEISRQSGLEVVVIRPTLVYGPGVKANFQSLLQAVRRGVPLPFGAVTDNRRSLVGLDNLTSLIACCVQHPDAAGRTFLVSDDEDVSTADLARRIGRALHRPARLLPVPPSVLMALGRLTGKSAAVGRLIGNLQVDIGPTIQRLGWRPPVSLDEGLLRAARAMPPRGPSA